MINNLVVNGCSYMHSYAQGQGHHDLAQKLGITGRVENLAIGGSANTRILRTALKHSYQTPEPTLYILGMTFVSRLEVPICEPANDFEGRWCNPQNQEFALRWQHNWSQKDSDLFVEIKLKSEVYSILDRTEDLMYRMIATVSDLRTRGHRVLMFQQADNLYQEHLTNPRLQFFDRPEIVDGFEWRATAWQASQGVKPKQYPPGSPYVPPDMTHPAVGHHAVLNDYLTNYLHDNKILQ
jgi:hypothetical protein